MSSSMIEKVGKFCRNFRIDVFGITLTEFCARTDSNIKSVSAFEHGRANSIKYLSLYYNECNEYEKETFARGLFKCL